MTQQKIEQRHSEEKPKSDVILRRNNRGCKSKDFYDWPEQSFDDMDSPLAVQQYIQQLIRRDPSDIDEILRLPESQDLGAWKVEHLRLFCMQLNRLATKLQDCCHPETCNQMTATEQWIFLCAAHKQPNECPAIDYTRHTLDGAASLLNSNKYFPSRVTIKESSVAKLGSVCRRVYRIFSHAYYHHFQVFDEFERETHLCKRFSKFVTIYELMSKDSLIVPSDGSKPETETTSTQKSTINQTVINIATAPQPEATQELSKQNLVNTTNDAKVNPELKAEQKSKLEESSTTKTVSTVPSSWASSQVTTNTMVKGGILGNTATNLTEVIKKQEAPASDSNESTEEKSISTANATPISTASNRQTSSKNVVESEA